MIKIPKLRRKTQIDKIIPINDEKCTDLLVGKTKKQDISQNGQNRYFSTSLMCSPGFLSHLWCPTCIHADFLCHLSVLESSQPGQTEQQISAAEQKSRMDLQMSTALHGTSTFTTHILHHPALSLQHGGLAAAVCQRPFSTFFNKLWKLYREDVRWALFMLSVQFGVFFF